jgi:hypothetical protein
LWLLHDIALTVAVRARREIIAVIENCIFADLVVWFWFGGRVFDVVVVELIVMMSVD